MCCFNLFYLCVTYNLTRIAISHFFLHMPFHRRGTSVDKGPITLIKIIFKIFAILINSRDDDMYSSCIRVNSYYTKIKCEETYFTVFTIKKIRLFQFWGFVFYIVNILLIGRGKEYGSCKPFYMFRIQINQELKMSMIQF